MTLEASTPGELQKNLPPLPLDEVPEEYKVVEFDHSEVSWNEISPVVVKLLREMELGSEPVLGDIHEDDTEV